MGVWKFIRFLYIRDVYRMVGLHEMRELYSHVAGSRFLLLFVFFLNSFHDVCSILVSKYFSLSTNITPPLSYPSRILFRKFFRPTGSKIFVHWITRLPSEHNRGWNLFFFAHENMWTDRHRGPQSTLLSDSTKPRVTVIFSESTRFQTLRLKFTCFITANWLYIKKRYAMRSWHTLLCLCATVVVTAQMQECTSPHKTMEFQRYRRRTFELRSVDAVGK